MKAAKKPPKLYWEMNTEELAAATREFDRESKGFHPLGPEKRRIWERLQHEESCGAEVVGTAREKDETGRSDVQQAAEEEIRKLLRRQYPRLTKCFVPLKDGSKVEVDACDQSHNIFIEIFARQGPVKDGQNKKIARDILKLLLLKYDFDPTLVTVGLAYANPAVHSFLTSDSWQGAAVRMFGIKLFNLIDEISPDLRQTIQAAECKQAKRRR
jgi:hypothetical protein